MVAMIESKAAGTTRLCLADDGRRAVPGQLDPSFSQQVTFQELSLAKGPLKEGIQGIFCLSYDHRFPQAGSSIALI
jgi:hypothetical protein